MLPLPVHIGTSGWSYKHWRGIYYPPKVRAADWLSFYATWFSTTEINGSFYRLPSEETVIKWASQVPAGFVFCPKMSRYLTHMKKLRDPEEPLERFFGVFNAMKSHIGPVLIQLPPQLPFQYDLADYFYSLLWKHYHHFSFVIEIRHNSWLSDDSLTLMSKYNVGLVISHSENTFPYSEMITATNIYVRFHGPSALYASDYTEAGLTVFAKKFLNWVEEGHTVWAYFNNDIHGYAPFNAKKLIEIIASLSGKKIAGQS